MYTKTLSGTIFQDLGGYLQGAGQGPVLSLESAGFEHSRPAELTPPRTPPTSHPPLSPMHPIVQPYHFSCTLTPLCLCRYCSFCLEFTSTSPTLVCLQSSHSSSSLWASSPSCEKPYLKSPGRQSFSLLCTQSTLKSPSYSQVIRCLLPTQ